MYKVDVVFLCFYTINRMKHPIYPYDAENLTWQSDELTEYYKQLNIWFDNIHFS
jgi:hypothetical protein